VIFIVFVCFTLTYVVKQLEKWPFSLVFAITRYPLMTAWEATWSACCTLK